MSNTQKQLSKKVRLLCISAVLLALSTALSFVKLWEFPWGGSITLVSMLPIMLSAIICGPSYGFGSAFVYSLVQLFLDLGKISGWGLTPEMLAGTVLLDYLLPFTGLGIAALFAKKGFAGKLTGIGISLAVRYISHTLSGVVLWHSAGKIWEGLVIGSEWLYSLVYNGCYMLPELIMSLIVAIILFKNTAFAKMLEKESGR